MELYTNSMMKDWNTCKNKYYYKYVKKIVIPQKEENFELGRKVHAMISYYLNGYNMDIMEKVAGEEVLQHYKSILSHPIIAQEHFLSEWGFNVAVENSKNAFVGRIDAIFYDKKNNKYTIADWKTGMKIPDNPLFSEQAQIYLYAFYRAQNDLGISFAPEDLSFVFIQTPLLKESRLEFSKELLEKFEENFLCAIKEMKNCISPVEIAENNNCKFCEYQFMCRKV